ncbi:MAG: RNA-binding transcriptional accessory protein [Planctomycetales bacterium]|nr:RNA-binding transcriptional accessory protein [Planctomycetales bacterium]
MTDDFLTSLAARVARELNLKDKQVLAALELLEAGNSIPFLARYRKEATGGLDEIALRAIEDALESARDLAQRKATILKTIEQQGALTEGLRRQIEQCEDKQVLEDLYLPYKPKRQTRASVAIERGLEPLANLLYRQATLGKRPQEVLRSYVDPSRDVPDEATALQGACDIVAQRWSEEASQRQWLAQQLQTHGQVVAQVKRGKNDPESKFAMYFDHREPLRRSPSHRILAMQRGDAEGILKIRVELDDDICRRQLRQRLITNPRFEFCDALQEACDDCYNRLLLPAVQSQVWQQALDKAGLEAIDVFAKNLRELLLASPAGPLVTAGVDPGFRTGCKVAVVDGTGKFLESATIYPTAPRNDEAGAGRTLLALFERHGVQLIAVGNGTASRETDQFLSALLKEHDLSLTKAVVSESGASIYSASELAGREYPDLDVTVRGAISIAHRLQDPLAELVKIDPKSIGVGQYQHDVDQKQLRKSLDREVESCVNSVGVDVNTASAELLSHVAGVGPKLAAQIVRHRDENGRFEKRDELRKVPKLGPKAFEQSAGFLRINDGEDPLDASAVHPETYAVVRRMAKSLQTNPAKLVGDAALVSRLQPQDFVDERFGLPTIQDILGELAKPGRDPRREFRAVQFAEGVNDVADVKAGMMLDGVITNVTHFGAFVDLGVHQDGLIHISQLADRYVQDPSEIVTVGDLVRVKILEVDAARRRISASLKEGGRKV